jgi:hypothetical protein
VSVKVMGLVWDRFAGQGTDLLLALALADEADHEGGAIHPSVPALAQRTRQSERTVQRQMRAMQKSEWLELVEKATNRKPAQYRINRGWLQGPEVVAAVESGGDTVSPLADSRGDNLSPQGAAGGDNLSPLEVFSSTEGSNVLSTTPRLSEDDDAKDRELAGWIFDLLLVLNPHHKEPNWRRWCREIRLMRERDGRTRKEIGGMFRWANADPFWRLNILSPAKLRVQWDALSLRRNVNRTGNTAGTKPDYTCGFDVEGHRCGAQGSRTIGGRWICNDHIQQAEDALIIGVRVTNAATTQGVHP